MPHIEWKSEYETGNEKVDSQHREIFALLSSLSNSIKEKKQKKVVKEVVEKLTIHIVEHFRDEENLMREKHYPDLLNHESCHKKIFNDAFDLIEKYREGEFEGATRLVVFLTGLITTHIQKEDKHFFDWLAQQDR